MNKISRFLALPVLSAGILAGALGAAGAAGAAVSTTTTNGSHAIVSSPDTKANNPTANNPTMHPYRHRHHSHNNYWRH